MPSISMKNQIVLKLMGVPLAAIGIQLLKSMVNGQKENIIKEI
jgi:hypothetical protein